MIEVLSEIEKELQLLERFKIINPEAKSFIYGEKSVVICGIKSILNLISHDKSTSSTNQADLFHFILQRENQVKHHFVVPGKKIHKTWIYCCINS